MYTHREAFVYMCIDMTLTVHIHMTSHVRIYIYIHMTSNAWPIFWMCRFPGYHEFLNFRVNPIFGMCRVLGYHDFLEFLGTLDVFGSAVFPDIYRTPCRCPLVASFYDSSAMAIRPTNRCSNSVIQFEALFRVESTMIVKRRVC